MGGSISKKASRSWEGACTTRPCAKRFKAALPKLVDSMERYGHLSPGPAVRDRLLKPIRATAPATGGGPHGSQTEIRPRGRGRGSQPRAGCSKSRTSGRRHRKQGEKRPKKRATRGADAQEITI